MNNTSFLLYGANGYTGQLIIETAAAYGLQPILAGRNKIAIKAMAQKYNLSYRIADLNNKAQLKKALENVSVVLHAAGPFRFTAEPMVAACLQTKTHYIDITGEIQVFEQVNSHSLAAKEAGIMLLSGAGFDVVPTDCTALFLKEALPDADTLILAFATFGSGGVSRGTALSITEKLGEPGTIRKNGLLKPVPLGHKGRWIDFGFQKKFAMTVPLGDVFSAYYSTGIANIECYTAVPKAMFQLLKAQSLFNPLLASGPVKNFIKNNIQNKPPGPTPRQRQKSKCIIWGEVTNNNGQTLQARSLCSNGYTFTAHSSLTIVKKILQGNYKPGYQTPASAYGSNLLLEISGSSMQLM